jgi:hypothetical protein
MHPACFILSAVSKSRVSTRDKHSQLIFKLRLTISSQTSNSLFRFNVKQSSANHILLYPKEMTSSISSTTVDADLDLKLLPKIGRLQKSQLKGHPLEVMIAVVL